MHRYKAGEPWWLGTPKLKALATLEQKARFKIDAWEEPIREWLGDRDETGVSEVLQHALGFEIEQHTQSAMNRVVTILTHLGFTRCRPRTSEGQRRPQRYRREPTPHGKSDE